MSGICEEDAASCERLSKQLCEKPIVSDAAVLSGPQRGGMTAFIVRQGYRPGPVFRDLVMSLTDDHERIQVALVRQIPRYADGRLDRKAALATLTDNALVVRYEPPSTDVERRLAALVHQVLPEVRVSMSDDLLSLGGDSLAAVELVELIAEQWGVEISGQDLFATESLRAMANVITRALGAGI
jgi:acyl carrier protein